MDSALTVAQWELLTVLIGGISTLAIFSFLIRENSFYRFFEHLYIGIAAGLGVVLTVKSFLWPQIFQPLLGLSIEHFPDGTTSEPYEPLLLLYLIPMLFGLLFYCIFSRRFGWLSKLVIGFMLGISGGAAFKGFFNGTFPQIVGSMKPLVVLAPDTSIDWMSSGTNVVFITTLLLVMYYFFFSFRGQRGAGERLSYGGRWLIMVCCGAYFGSTVMARMALLVERLQFLSTTWLDAVVQVVRG